MGTIIPHKDASLVQKSAEQKVNYLQRLWKKRYLVDVGVVEAREMRDGKQQKVQYEVDFIATNGQEKYYIQWNNPLYQWYTTLFGRQHVYKI
ncbi:MAG: hypothetical protein IJ047_04645 [Paludibacteraceae bacterium]|nr:hypothetical protein [Paludibacteraceae bacterium]